MTPDLSALTAPVLRRAFQQVCGLAIFACAPLSASAGFSIQGGLLFDDNGNEFIMRGIAFPHVWFPQQTAAAIPNIADTGANCVRLVLGNGEQWGPNSEADVAALIELCKANRLIAIPEVHDCTGFGDTGGFAPNAAPLSTAVDYWISIQDALMGQENFVIINIANEPIGNGPPASTWVNEHITAITRLRAAGFTHTLMVDAANWGQDWQNIMRQNAQTVFDADPLSNVIFSVHMYEVYQSDTVINSYMTTFIQAGLPLLVGEFGATHGSNDVNEGAIMARAEQYGIGYIGWSWSGNGGGVEALDVALNFNPATLSSWGQTLINGLNGIGSTSQFSSVFGNVPTLQVSPTTVSAPAAGASATLTVTSNQSWSVTDNQTWITVAPASGTGNGSFTVTTAAHTDPAPRTGIVNVTGGGLTRNITVTQIGTGGFGVCANPVAVTLPFTRDGVADSCLVTGGTINYVNSWNTQLVEINGVAFTNVFVNGSSLPPRINGNYYIRYVGTVPWAHLEVTGSGGGTTSNLSLAPTALSFTAAAGSSNVVVTSNVSWTATDNQTWITVAPASGTNNGTVAVSVAANTATTARTGTVTVSGGGLTQTVAITQAGSTPTETLTVAPTALSFTSAAGSNTFAITSNVSWTITDNQTWITVTPASGANNASATVAVTANTGPTARTGTVTVTGGGLTQTVAITQAGITPNTLEVSPSSLSFTATGGGSGVTVTSNTSWTVTDDQPWITIAVPGGANNGSFVVVASANAAATSRSGTVTVTGGGLTRVIAVTQAGAGTTPCANPTAITLPFARDGVGEFCFVTSGTINFVNSWNMQLVEVNGVAFTNVWVSGANLPARIDGNYYIRYVGNFPWSHLEITGSP